MNTMREVQVPDIGDFKEVPVIEVLVGPGDRVTKDAPLIVLETDKATMEIPSPSSGVIRQLWIKVGDRINKGMPLLILEDDTQSESTPARIERTTTSAEPPGAMVAAATGSATLPPIEPETSLIPAPAKPQADLRTPTHADRTVRASPALRKLGRKLGVDLARVKASGPGNRLTREDVEGFVRGELIRPAAGPAANAGLSILPWPQVDFARFGAVERQPLPRLRKISGANLARNWAMIPHVTNFEEADITELEAFRIQLNREHGSEAPKLTMLAFLIKACIDVLRKFPSFNASLEGEELVLKHYFHVGFAADTPNGLVVPVIRDADRKGLLEIARETSALAALARAGKLNAEQMQGGCITISSLGGIGGTGFTPIINAPEVAILGVTRADLKPKWDGAQFKPRLMLPLNLSWDHRVVDGAAAARFLARLRVLLEDFRHISL